MKRYPFRTKETYERYEAYKHDGNLDRSCPLCDGSPLAEFNYWKIMVNRFPYDRISETHHMLVPKRHIVEDELTSEENRELFLIKHGYVSDTYVFIFEALQQYKSVPDHFHLHLIIPKTDF